jgi:hypothetical protein
MFRYENKLLDMLAEQELKGREKRRMPIYVIIIHTFNNNREKTFCPLSSVLAREPLIYSWRGFNTSARYAGEASGAFLKVLNPSPITFKNQHTPTALRRGFLLWFHFHTIVKYGFMYFPTSLATISHNVPMVNDAWGFSASSLCEVRVFYANYFL